MKKNFILLFVLVFLVLIFSCTKKERLQTNTLQLIVLPNPVLVQIGTSIELTCNGKSAKSDNVDINPIWEVNSTVLGTVSPTRGKKVIFTAGNQTGSGKIKVQEGEVYTEINISVVQSTQTTSGGGGGSSVLVFYDDSGLNNQFGTPDIFTWSAGVISSSEESNSGNSIDSSKYQRFTSVSSWFGGGIVINKVSGNPASSDLSSYYTGKSLKFYVRINRALTASEKIKIEIEHTSQGTKSAKDLSSSYGFNSQSTSWQEISIPLSDFGNVDYTKILLPFEITVENNGSSLTLDWDYVRWE